MHIKQWFALLLLLLTACQPNTRQFNGYLDADMLYLSSDIAGRLQALAVTKGQMVHAQQFLFRAEQTNEHYQVVISKLNQSNLMAQQNELSSQLKYIQANFQRIRMLLQQHAASQDDAEAAAKDVAVATQKLAAIAFQIQSSQMNTRDKEWLLSRKIGTAPNDGIIFDIYYRPGEYLRAGDPVLSLITQDNIKVVFFVPEAQLSQVRLNQRLTISTDQQPHFASGHIFYISAIAEYTPPIIYSPSERQKLVFRVEAKIDHPDLQQLHLGQPVTLELS